MGPWSSSSAGSETGLSNSVQIRDRTHHLSPGLHHTKVREQDISFPDAPDAVSGQSATVPWLENIGRSITRHDGTVGTCVHFCNTDDTSPFPQNNVCISSWLCGAHMDTLPQDPSVPLQIISPANIAPVGATTLVESHSGTVIPQYRRSVCLRVQKANYHLSARPCIWKTSHVINDFLFCWVAGVLHRCRGLRHWHRRNGNVP